MASLPARVLLCVVAGALCGTALTVALLGARDRSAGHDDTAAAPTSVEPVGSRAREVLRRWDAARAAAWTSGDPDALAGLYTPASVAGRRDVAMLRAWVARRARVTTLATQVLRLQVLLDRPRRLVLVVTDRVAVVRAASPMPQDRPSTRRLSLVRAADGRWRVASVSPERPARSRASS